MGGKHRKATSEEDSQRSKSTATTSSRTSKATTVSKETVMKFLGINVSGNEDAFEWKKNKGSALAQMSTQQQEDWFSDVFHAQQIMALPTFNEWLCSNKPELLLLRPQNSYEERPGTFTQIARAMVLFHQAKDNMTILQLSCPAQDTGSPSRPRLLLRNLLHQMLKAAPDLIIPSDHLQDSHLQDLFIDVLGAMPLTRSRKMYVVILGGLGEQQPQSEVESLLGFLRILTEGQGSPTFYFKFLLLPPHPSDWSEQIPKEANLRVPKPNAEHDENVKNAMMSVTEILRLNNLDGV